MWYPEFEYIYFLILPFLSSDQSHILSLEFVLQCGGSWSIKKNRESVTLSWYWPTFCELAEKAGTRFHGIMTNLHFPPQNLLCSDPRYICIFPLCCHIGLSECKLLRRPKASYRIRRTRHNKGLSCNLQVCCISEIGWRNNASVTQGTYIYLCNLYALLNGNHNYFTLRLHNSSISPAYKPSLE